MVGAHGKGSEPADLGRGHNGILEEKNLFQLFHNSKS